MGTDSGGGPGRFQGYFEHLELEYETKAGLTPMQALVSATSGAAKAINISKQVGRWKKASGRTSWCYRQIRSTTSRTRAPSNPFGSAECACRRKVTG